LAYSLTLKMEVMYSSKMLDDFHQISWHYMPQCITLCVYITLGSLYVSVSVQYRSYVSNSNTVVKRTLFSSADIHTSKQWCILAILSKNKSHISASLLHVLILRLKLNMGTPANMFLEWTERVILCMHTKWIRRQLLHFSTGQTAEERWCKQNCLLFLNNVFHEPSAFITSLVQQIP
jgi:hypothetical protein